MSRFSISRTAVHLHPFVLQTGNFLLSVSDGSIPFL